MSGYGFGGFPDFLNKSFFSPREERVSRSASSLPSQFVDRTVLVLDCETTGPDPATAQVVEIAIRSGLSDDGGTWVRRVRPRISIPAGAVAIHGISDEDVASCPRFTEVAQEVRDRLSAARVIIGYNVGYDLAVLEGEFRRNGLPAFERGDRLIVDAYRLWARRERRTLSDAHLRFAGAPLTKAHGAGEDAAATARVFLGMLAAFDLERASWTELAHLAGLDGSGMKAKTNPPVILFDGVCNLCSAWVRFVARWDEGRRYRLAALGSPAAARLLERNDAGSTDSVILIEEGRTFTESEAALRILAGLGGVWSLTRVARLVPRPVRDVVYRWVARNRYRWFGRKDRCELPDAGLRERFLEGGLVDAGGP